MSGGGLEVRAEILKLAQLLHVDPERFAYLSGVAAKDLRRLREQVTDRLYDADKQAFERLASASRRLPDQAIAKIGERAIGPLIAARVTGLLEPRRAIELSSRVSPEFLADIATEVDPRRADAIIAGIPADRIAAAAEVLQARGEHVAMGRFVGHVSDEALLAALEVLDDGSVLRTAFVLENKRRLDRLVGMLPEERLVGLIRAAARGGLWPEALDLLSNLGKRHRRRFADLAAEADEAVLESLVEDAQAHGFWDDALPLVQLLNDEGRRRFAALPAVQRAPVLDELVDSAVRCGLVEELLPLVELLPARARRRVTARLDQPEPIGG